MSASAFGGGGTSMDTTAPNAAVTPLDDGGLAADCKRMLNNSRFADVKFIVQGQPIYGNRQFLAMRCEGFAKMFEQQKNTGEFIINEQDCSYDAFLTVPVPRKRCDCGAWRPHPLSPPRCLNTSTPVKSPTSPSIASLKSSRWLRRSQTRAHTQSPPPATMLSPNSTQVYGVDALKVHCASQIQNAVNPENAAQMLVMMEEAGSKEMKQFCLDFIVANREKVIVTPGFEQLSTHPQLLMDVAKGFAAGGY